MTLATLGISNFESAVLQFNEQNPCGIKVSIIDHQKDGTREAAIDRLNLDLAAGNGPDIIDFESFPSRGAYARQGFLLDMSSYFDAAFEKDDFFVLDILDPSKMYYFPSSFSIMSCCGLSGVFPGMSAISIDEYMELSSTPQFASAYAETQAGFLEAICFGAMDSFVDMGSLSCTFDDGRFAGLLEFAKNLDDGAGQSDLNALQQLAAGSLLYMHTWVRTPLDIMNAEKDIGGPLNYIGYPTLDKSNGSFIYLSALAGVNSSTEHPELAWEFVKYFISDEALQSNIAWDNIPISKAACQKHTDDLLAPYAKYDGHTITLNDDGSFNVDGVYMDQVYDPTPIASNAQIEKFYALIQNATAIYQYDPDIYSIIENAAAQYFADERSVQATVSDIQARVSIYLAEQG